jgi:hypothetical protein
MVPELLVTKFRSSPRNQNQRKAGTIRGAVTKETKTGFRAAVCVVVHHFSASFTDNMIGHHDEAPTALGTPDDMQQLIFLTPFARLVMNNTPSASSISRHLTACGFQTLRSFSLRKSSMQWFEHLKFRVFADRSSSVTRD